MDANTINILLIEDNPGDARLIREMLSDTDVYNCVLECAARLSTGLEHLVGGTAGIILLDLELPDSQGLDTLEKVRARVPEIPVVVLTGLDDESVALEAVRRGAQDYLVKGTINGRILWRVMNYAIERKASEQLLEEIFHTSTIGMYITREGKFIITNPQFQKITGYGAEDLLGMDSLGIVFYDDRDTVRQYAIEMLKGQHPASYEFRYITRSGEIRWALESVASVLYKRERVLLGSFMDINEKKKLDAQLLIAGKLASIGELAAGIAHEINNPLTIVTGYAQLLLENDDIPEEMASDLQKIYNESQRVVKIIQNLMSFARRNNPGKDSVEVNEVIGRALELQNYELVKSNITLTTHLAGDLPPLIADFNQLQQVVLTIMTNAQQALMEITGKRKITLSTSAERGFIRISIADNGPGIAVENMTRIFDPFFTTKEVGSGSGLGLSVCHGIVSEHNGRIYVESTTGKGATFVVELPLTDQSENAARQKKTGHPDRLPEGTK
jgi:two-component system NtrC family sensor kinase